MDRSQFKETQIMQMKQLTNAIASVLLLGGGGDGVPVVATETSHSTKFSHHKEEG